MSQNKNLYSRRSILQGLGTGITAAVGVRADDTIAAQSSTAALGSEASAAKSFELPPIRPDDIVLQTSSFALSLGTDGWIKSFRLANGWECLARSAPFIWAIQERPYQNELQLTGVARPTRFACRSIELVPHGLRARFYDIDHEVTIAIEILAEMLVFRVKQIAQIAPRFKSRFHPETPLDALTFAELPLKAPQRFGEWLNVAWYEGWGVGLLGTGPRSLIQSDHSEEQVSLSAQAREETGLTGTGAALIAAPELKFFDCIAALETAEDLPQGVAARRLPLNTSPYLFVETLQDLDRQLELARNIGLRAVLLSYRAIMTTAGHFLYKPEVGGLEGLAALVQRLREGGFWVGFHVHYTKAMFDDPYITPVPDKRLYQASLWRLSVPVSARDTTLTLQGSTSRPEARSAQKTLRIDDEFIQFERLEQGPDHLGWRAVGCTRGAHGSNAAYHTKYASVGLCSDVVGVVGIYEQDSDLPDEVAARIAEINKPCRFDFFYYDGAEDVPPPYWYTVSLAQIRVWCQLNTPVLSGEGACRAHASWHLLSRGHAFDVFENDEQKRAVREVIAPQARRMRDDLTPINFGWLRLTPPSRATVGTQPDTIEYTASRAAAYGCPLSVILPPNAIDETPRLFDCLAVLRHWQSIVSSGQLSTEMASRIRDSDAEFLLLPSPNGPKIVEGTELIREDRRNVRIITFELDRVAWAVIWAPISRGTISLPAPGCEIWSVPGGDRHKYASTRVSFGERTWLRFPDTDVADLQPILRSAQVRA